MPKKGGKVSSCGANYINIGDTNFLTRVVRKVEEVRVMVLARRES
jgi:hypothetical protein